MKATSFASFVSSKEEEIITTASPGSPVFYSIQSYPQTHTYITTQQRITLLIKNVNRVDKVQGDIAQAERRDRDRMVALRGIIKESLARSPNISTVDADALVANLQVAHDSLDNADDGSWDSYRNSFTILMSRGYLQTVDQLRDCLLTTEWEIHLRPLALQMGVSKFESQCAAIAAPGSIDYDVISALYEDPTNLEVIKDEGLRMQARACIATVEAEHRLACYQNCTAEAQKLAQQFSEGEFISKLLPDPIEHGVVDSMRKIISSASSVSKLMSGGKV